MHRDRLGSPVLVTDENAEVYEERSFGPFGRPRNQDWNNGSGLLGSEVSNRGFTEHEHVDDEQIIHMNGRAYDYNLGRFLSVDPFIQSPANSQSLNPYSYIMNNPMSGTDPTGYRASASGEAARAFFGSNGSEILYSRREVGSLAHFRQIFGISDSLRSVDLASANAPSVALTNNQDFSAISDLVDESSVSGAGLLGIDARQRTAIGESFLRDLYELDVINRRKQRDAQNAEFVRLYSARRERLEGSSDAASDGPGFLHIHHNPGAAFAVVLSYSSAFQNIQTKLFDIVVRDFNLGAGRSGFAASVQIARVVGFAEFIFAGYRVAQSESRLDSVVPVFDGSIAILGLAAASGPAAGVAAAYGVARIVIDSPIGQAGIGAVTDGICLASGDC